MKNYKILFLGIVSAMIFYSCADEDTNPLKYHADNSLGAFVTIVQASPIIDFTDPSGAYEFTLDDPGKSVESYDLGVSWASAGGGSDTISIATVSSFPATLSYTLSDLAGFIGVGADEFSAGDKFNFYATVTGNNGTVSRVEDVSGNVLGRGMKQGFTHTVFIACPFVQADAIGSYLITRDDFVTTLEPDRLIEAIAGPDENSITFVNLFSHPEKYDVTVTVDQASGIASVSKQPAWHCDNFGCGFGEGRVDGGGFYFSCTGFATLDLRNTVDLGSFGVFKLELTKQ